MVNYTALTNSVRCKRVCSNNGGEAITDRTLDHWKNSLPREQLQLFDMEQLLTLRAFNEKGELLQSYFVVTLQTEIAHTYSWNLD